MPKGRYQKGQGGGEGAAMKKKDRAVRQAMRKERKAGAYLTPGDPDFRSFANQLQTQGMRLQDVPGDGNCLFRALADQLRDGHSSHRSLRRTVVQFMRENKEDFAPFVEDEVSFEDHVAELAKDGEFAGNDAIVAFARCHGVNVVIHQLNAPRWEVHAAVPPEGKTLHIAYLNGEHYCSLRPLLREQLLPSVAVNPQGSSMEEAQTSPRESRERGRTVEAVMQNSGCQDLEMVEQCLRENAYDPDMAVVELLQLMDLTDFPQVPAKVTEREGECGDTKRKTTAGAEGSGSVAEGRSQGGGKQQKKGPPQPQRHISNRERKEVAKAARKERRVQEQRTRGKQKEEPNFDPVGAMAI